MAASGKHVRRTAGKSGPRIDPGIHRSVPHWQAGILGRLAPGINAAAMNFAQPRAADATDRIGRAWTVPSLPRASART